VAQSPSNLQEPSMDELLASIREIIEESSAAQEEDEFLSETNGDHAYSQGVNGVRGERLQDDNTVPIQDAMKALAARIGLKKQVSTKPEITRVAALPEQEAVVPSPPPFVPPPTVTVVPTSSPVPPATPHAPVRLSPFAHLNPSTSAGKKTQLSNNGQNVSTRPTSVPSKIIDAPKQPDSQHKKTLPPESNTRESSTSGAVPLFPQVRGISTPSNSQNSPSAPVRIKPEMPSSQSPKTNDTAKSLAKDFVAEFEQSAESLLRPYIASWLEAHFHDLFEKILREELQRLISQNLRR